MKFKNSTSASHSTSFECSTSQDLTLISAKQYVEENIAKGTTDPDGGRLKLAKNGQTLSANANPLDLFDQPLLLDMIFLGTPQLCGGAYIYFFFKVSLEKLPNVHVHWDFTCFAATTDFVANYVDFFKNAILRGLPDLLQFYMGGGNFSENSSVLDGVSFP